MIKIGFIGLGHMGQPMACNLINAGYEVHVLDVVPAAVNEMVKRGAKSAASVADLASEVDVVFTMVQTGSQVNAICIGSDGLFKHLKSGALYIDCSSIDMVSTRALHEAANQHEIAMLDAPVSGGVYGAESGTLTIMVGGDEADVERALPILNAIGKKIVHAGPAGCGQAAKICNNLLLGISMIGVSEAFSLAAKLGLDQKKFFEISSNASGQCWAMTSYCPVPGILENAPSSHDYKAGFMAKMMLKDLRLGQHAAEAVDASVPLGAVATELYELFVRQGEGEKDFSAIINMIAN